MPKLNWQLLIKKRAGVTQGVPPGKELWRGSLTPLR